MAETSTDTDAVADGNIYELAANLQRRMQDVIGLFSEQQTKMMAESAKLQHNMQDVIGHFSEQQSKLMAEREATMKQRKECREECDTLKEETKSECQKMRQSAQQHIDALKEEIRLEIDALKEEVRLEKAALQSEKDAMEGVHTFQTSKISLDVGGHKFTTSLQTLTSISDTFLSSMFSGRFQLKSDGNGYYFIDRDGEHFRFILNYLRDPTAFTLKGLNRNQQAELAVEAQYYGLRERMFPYWDAEEVGIELLRRTLSLTKPSRTLLIDVMSQAKSVVVKLSSREVDATFLGVYALMDVKVNGALVWAQQSQSRENDDGLYWMWTSTVPGKLWIGAKQACERGEERGFLCAVDVAARAPIGPDARWQANRSASKEAIWRARAKEDGTHWIPCDVSVEVLSAIPEDIPEVSSMRGWLNQMPQ